MSDTLHISQEVREMLADQAIGEACANPEATIYWPHGLTPEDYVAAISRLEARSVPASRVRLDRDTHRLTVAPRDNGQSLFVTALALGIFIGACAAAVVALVVS